MMKELSKPDWVLLSQVAYLVLTLVVCLKIVYDTRNTTKALAYILLTIFLPVVGALVYFSVGINYRQRSLYSKKLSDDETLLATAQQRIIDTSRETMQAAADHVKHNRELARLLVRDNVSPLLGGNRVTLLLNGEEKFAQVLDALEGARHHIHIEYYIFEDDQIGNALKEVLIRKAREGVQVRFIYDDFGSRSIRRTVVPQLRAAGVQAYPFHKILFVALANRLNYRNHRKIIVIDGCTAFTGGINVSDRYINYPGQPDRLYWRDTHLRIDGAGSYYLQYVFLCDWNFCAAEKLLPDQSFFCPTPREPADDGAIVQIGASGPDSRLPTLLYAFLQVISLAERELLITTPYFIPNDSLLDAILIAALSGVSVKLLVPGKSDSRLVNAAAYSYYSDLLNAGVEIYRYRKGFVHAKTLVADGRLAAVGTANLDNRSFDMNFEVVAFVYDTALAGQLGRAFHEDLLHAERIVPQQWQARSRLRQLGEKVARLVSPLL
jgi:cardiolipin synthase